MLKNVKRKNSIAFSFLTAPGPLPSTTELRKSQASPDCSINKNAVGTEIWLWVQAWGDDCALLIETQWQETLCFKDSVSYPQVLQINLLPQCPHQLQTASLGLLHPCFSSPALLEHWLSLYLCPAWRRTQLQALLWHLNTGRAQHLLLQMCMARKFHSWWCSCI